MIPFYHKLGDLYLMKPFSFRKIEEQSNAYFRGEEFFKLKEILSNI
jgi:hypothetical protein